MRFLALFLAAWIAWWSVVPISKYSDTRLDLEVGLSAAFVALIFAFLTWMFVRRKDDRTTISAAGRLLLVIGLLGFGGAYGEAKDAGLEFGQASLSALIGLPGLVMLTGVAATQYAKRLSSAA